MTKPRKVGRDGVTLTRCRHDSVELTKVAKAVQKKYAGNGYLERLAMVRVGDKKYSVLGSGCERTAVALCKSHVLKVVTEPDGYSSSVDQTKSEVIRFTEATAALRRLLCPIVAYAANYRWLLMPRAKPVTDAQLDRSDIERKANRLGVADIYKSNVGVLSNGRVVVLDYGLDSGGYTDSYDSDPYGYTTSDENEGCGSSCAMCYPSD